jgi:hypothetical protein
MGVGGRADHHGVDVVGGKDGLGAPDFGAGVAGQRLGRGRARRRRRPRPSRCPAPGCCGMNLPMRPQPSSPILSMSCPSACTEPRMTARAASKTGSWVSFRIATRSKRSPGRRSRPPAAPRRRPCAVRADVELADARPGGERARCASGTPEPPWITSGTSVTASMARMRGSSSPPSWSCCRCTLPTEIAMASTPLSRAKRAASSGSVPPRPRRRNSRRSRSRPRRRCPRHGPFGDARGLRDVLRQRLARAVEHQRGEAAVERLAAFVDGVAVVEMGDDRHHALGQVPEHRAQDRQRRMRPAGRPGLQDDRRALGLGGHA